MKGCIKLRPATTVDIPLLRYWDGLPHILAATGDEDWEWEKELAETHELRESFMIELNGQPVGFLQIIDPACEETGYWGEISAGVRALDIWIGEKDVIGQGVGSEATRQALARCFADSTVTAVLVDPMADNIRARRFYERMGFRFLENRRFGTDDCCVYRVRRREVAPDPLAGI